MDIHTLEDLSVWTYLQLESVCIVFVVAVEIVCVGVVVVAPKQDYRK